MQGRKVYSEKLKQEVIERVKKHPEKNLLEINQMFPSMSKMVLYTLLNKHEIPYKKQCRGHNKRIKKTTTDPKKYFEHDPYYKF